MVTGFAFSGGRVTAPFAAGAALLAGAFVSVFEVVSVSVGFAEGLAETSAGDGEGDGGGAGGITLDCASALTAKSTMSAMSKTILFIMISLSERFGFPLAWIIRPNTDIRAFQNRRIR